MIDPHCLLHQQPARSHQQSPSSGNPGDETRPLVSSPTAPFKDLGDLLLLLKKETKRPLLGAHSPLCAWGTGVRHKDGESCTRTERNFDQRTEGKTAGKTGLPGHRARSNVREANERGRTVVVGKK